jgi:CHAD domain-containing protein
VTPQNRDRSAANGIRHVRVFALTRTMTIFQKQVASLNAAVFACRGSQEMEPVHHLRVGARRVEAQLSLLEMLRVLPSGSEQASEVRKRLKRIRRAAGTVRDLDVQIELTRRSGRTKAGSRKLPDRMRHAARHLRKHLQRQREHEALKLQGVLRREGGKLELALRTLQTTLRPKRESPVATKQLIARIEFWFHATTTQGIQHARLRPKAGSQFDDLHTEEGLHKLRKAAKLGRYMVESLRSRSLAAKQLARNFEAIQEAGGYWHDWLLVEESAAKHTEKDGELPKHYAAYRDIALAKYRLQLANLLPGRIRPGTVPVPASSILIAGTAGCLEP